MYLIHSYLTERKAKAKLEGELSDEVDVKIEVSQGSLHGSLLSSSSMIYQNCFVLLMQMSRSFWLNREYQRMWNEELQQGFKKGLKSGVVK